MSIGERILNALSYGGIVAVIGMAVVFFGLFLLILCVSAMAAFFKAKDKKKIENPAKAPTAPEAPVAAPVVEDEIVDDAQLIAVIAAAIAAFDNSGKTLVVRRVRRVSGWNRAAREEQVCRF